MKIHILRVRKGVPGIGRMIGKRLETLGYAVQEVTCDHSPHFRVNPEDLVINYGRSSAPIWKEDSPCTWLNTPKAVSLCVNKIATLDELYVHSVPALVYSETKINARQWLREGSSVFCRTTVTGKKGRGIVIANTEADELVDAPLYTKAFPQDLKNKREFRVHVFKGKVIDYVQKKKMGEERLQEMGINEVNLNIRNRGKGWVFCHNDIINSRLVKELGVSAAEAVGIDYCAVDIIGEWNKDEKRIVSAKVCEINSAPGMTAETTKKAYINAFDAYIKELNPTI